MGEMSYGSCSARMYAATWSSAGGHHQSLLGAPRQQVRKMLFCDKQSHVATIKEFHLLILQMPLLLITVQMWLSDVAGPTKLGGR
jgi:hypothetical protein